MLGRKKDTSEKPPFKLLLWTAIAGLIFGLIGFGAIAENMLRTGRNSLHWHKASGNIALVKIDDQSLREIGRWPWPRRNLAQLTNALSAAGAKRIFFDLTFDGPTNSADDRQFAAALQRSGRVYLAVRTRAGPEGGSQLDAAPMSMFARVANIGNISVRYNYQNAVWHIPYALSIGNRSIPSFAAELANLNGNPGETFMPDYSVDPATIPSFSASSILKNPLPRRVIKGKDIVIGWTSETLGDQYFLPGTGKMGGAYIHIIGAETLRSGRPVYLGWIPFYILSLVIAAAALFVRSERQQALLLAGSIAALLFGPAALEAHLVFVDITPGVFVILTVGAVLLRNRFRKRGLVDPVSGLPNLNALRLNKLGRNQALVVARILNYAEIVATLPQQSERQLVEQIVSRLSVGEKNRTFYQGDDGIFAWFEESKAAFGNHVDALYSLFRNPVRVASMPIDVSISFGIELGSGRSLANRLGSALVAADEAAHDGLRWKYHDPESLENASWKLSMLSQLDEAIDRGEVWVAYQPKLDLASRKTIGAEALARWTHPEKGPIAASEFVAAAEQHDRIAKLTDFVLDKAVATAAAIVRRGQDFNIAVNLSARLLADKNFTWRVSAVLARHKLEPRHLTLELTETAALTESADALDMLEQLRELGINISIDDYGTGLSTLDYLKKIPASEIKIDQSFVKGMLDNRSDRLMVQSTIALAQSLGLRVVAEGVEERGILDALVEMKCDIAQGFTVGRPMSLDGLIKRMAGELKRHFA